MASSKALYLPLGSVFLLDILSLMNRHSSHLRSHRGSWPLPGHTHSSLLANRVPPVVKHHSHSENCSCHRSSSAGIFVCVLPSLISDHTHLFTCDRQPMPLGCGPVTPLVFCAALRHLCIVWKMRGTGGTSVDCLDRTRGPPLQSYITVRNLAVCSHEEHQTLFCRHMPGSHTVNMNDTCMFCFCKVWHEGRDGTDINIILSRYLSDSF